MSHSTDPDNYFQTLDSIAERNRKAAKARDNKNGQPIKLASKVLAILADPRDADLVWVAESAGVARSVKLSTSKPSPPFRQPPSSTQLAAPLTSLALLPGTSSQPAPILLAGSWSSQIHAWSTETRALLFTLSGGHGDFVKCLTVIPLAPSAPGTTPGATSVLASGGSDARITLWDVATRTKVATLEGHERGVLALAADPLPDTERSEAGALWSAGSGTHIRRWAVCRAGDGLKAHETPFAAPLAPHETSVTALAFSPASADLWSASADGSAVCLARPETQSAGDQGMAAWSVETTLRHPSTNALRAVAPTADGRFVVTAGRDEDVWIWDAGSGDLAGKFVGHADEVYGVDITKDGKIVSAGLDCTVRLWDLADLGKEPVADADEAEEQAPTEKGGKRADVELTAEEEAELAELMDD